MKVYSLSKFVVLIFAAIFAICKVECRQKRSLPEKPYLNLITALCTDEDGGIRKSCLQSISTAKLIEEIYSRLSSETGYGKPGNTGAVDLTPVNADPSLAEKRGRERLSGFYSNW